MSRQSERTPTSYCPNPKCNAELSAAFHPDHPEAVAGPGDITLCSYCASVLIYDENTKVRLLTTEELNSIERETQVEITTFRAFLQANPPPAPLRTKPPQE